MCIGNSTTERVSYLNEVESKEVSISGVEASHSVCLQDCGQMCVWHKVATNPWDARTGPVHIEEGAVVFTLGHNAYPW